jgi:hypothetical protein
MCGGTLPRSRDGGGELGVDAGAHGVEHAGTSVTDGRSRSVRSQGFDATDTRI